MALSQNQRLRRAAQKAARRKEIVAGKRKAEAATAVADNVPSAYARQAPIRACLMTDGLFDLGVGTVVLARNLPAGDVGVSFFLVDTWCLGVKDAFYRVMPAELFEANAESVWTAAQTFVDIEPSQARKLLHDAAAFAKSVGFAPNENFAAAEQLFGDIAMGNATFSFGKDGKPFFVPGPNDSPARTRRVFETMAPKGYRIVDIIAEIDGDTFDGEESHGVLPLPPP